MKRIIVMSICIIVFILLLLGCSNKEREMQTKVNAFLKVEEFEKANECVNTYINENPDNPFGRELKIRVLVALGDSDEALMEYLKFTKLKGKHSKQLLQIIYNILWRYDKATEFLLETYSAEKIKINDLLTEIIIELFEKHVKVISSEDLRDSIMETFFILKNKKTIPVLTNITKNTNDREEIRKKAINLICEISKEKAINTLLPLLKDSSQSIRLLSAEKLLVLENLEGKSMLNEFAFNNINSETYENQIKSAHIMGLLSENEKSKEELLKILNNMVKTGDWKSKLLDETISSLMKIGYPTEAIEPIKIVLFRFPGSWDTYTNILINSIHFLRDVKKSEEQEEDIEKIYVQFIEYHTIYQKRVADKGSTRVAYNILKSMNPELANALLKKIPRRDLNKRGIY